MKRIPKDQRYRDKCFPNAEVETFDPKKAGFAPLPLIARELLPHLQGSELKVWIYLLTKGGRFSICYPTYEDIMRGTKIAVKGTISKAVRRLERIGLIKVHNDSGTRRYLLRDPRLAVEKLFLLGELDFHGLEEANDLLEAVKQEIIVPLQFGKVVQP